MSFRNIHVSNVHGGSVFLAFMICCLLSTWLPPFAQAEFEEPVNLSAVDFLNQEMLKGAHHSVLDQVTNDGMFNHYQVTSPFGEFSAPSTASLQFLVIELEAIAAMKEVKTDDTAIASLKQSGENTVAGIKSLFTDTEDTLKGAASGVQSLFSRASGTIGKREVTGAEDSKVEQLIGFSKSKGAIATKFGVNVYSRNQVLQEELDRLGWADYLGGLGVGVATSAVPGIGGIVMTTSGTTRLLNEAINTTPASELWVQNHDTLLSLGMDEDTVKLFLNHQSFSPALTTVMTTAIKSMKGIDNLELFLKVSLQASSSEMARVITETVVLTAGYHKHVGPLKKIVPMARITRADGSDGSIVVVLPTDYLIWSQTVAGVISSFSAEEDTLKMPGKQLWTLGTLSEKARAECEKAGWQVNTNARSRLIPPEK